MRGKRHKCGLKLFVLAAAQPSYVLAFDMKTEAHNLALEGVFEGTKVVMNLLRRAKLLNTRRSVCTDNYYTSLELMQALRRAGMYGFGVLRKTRAPRPVRMAERSHPRGTWKETVHRDTQTVCTAWQDNRVVYFLSNCSNTGGAARVTRGLRGVGDVEVPCLEVVHDYNVGMGPIDQVQCVAMWTASTAASQMTTACA